MYISIANAALVTADHLAALGNTLFISRLPATSSACGRDIAEAIGHDRWKVVGTLAHTKLTKNRPVASYKAAEGQIMLYGKTDRARDADRESESLAVYDPPQHLDQPVAATNPGARVPVVGNRGAEW